MKPPTKGAGFGPKVRWGTTYPCAGGARIGLQRGARPSGHLFYRYCDRTMHHTCSVACTGITSMISAPGCSATTTQHQQSARSTHFSSDSRTHSGRHEQSTAAQAPRATDTNTKQGGMLASGHAEGGQGGQRPLQRANQRQAPSGAPPLSSGRLSAGSEAVMPPQDHLDRQSR